MTICDNCIHRNVCADEGHYDESLSFCADKVEERPHEWIPVSERLPEGKIDPRTGDFELVLCSTTWGDVRFYKFGKPIKSDKAHFWCYGYEMDDHIIAWMPLPEPYKETANER